MTPHSLRPLVVLPALWALLLALPGPAAAMPGNIDCSDPGYSFLPSCSAPGKPGFMSAADYEKLRVQHDTVMCNKAKIACKRLRPADRQTRCLAHVDDLGC